MSVFVDTNVVLDLLLTGRAGKPDAQQIFNLGAYGTVALYVSPISFATAAYFLEKASSPVQAKAQLYILRGMVNVSIDDQHTVDAAFALTTWPDFEDALQYASALAVDAEAIVTNNTSDFVGATLPVLTPAAYLQQL